MFQYGEETLRFGGGRLLLRGVNGSGKSTAMNMLLPFLLDADVRRIDAAGEQSGVLRSWMLSGRTENQPTGYLWIEVCRADEHLAFGCGIKASRSTDSVNHWWFVTDRRPGIDLDLVQPIGGGSRAPLSAEQLRAEIGAPSVWTKDQRSAYRTALHGRLYGGANLDQHVRLLHIVRNPRVGDRVDVDLPNHLHDALPQLSDAAVDDAATPLEQLEEHRRNVSQLSATVRTLDALVATYRQYARSELGSRARTADSRASDHRRLETEVKEATQAHRTATAEVERIEATIHRWSGAVDIHRGELDALRKSPAYRSATQLDDRRAEVGRLAEGAGQAANDLATAIVDLGAAADDVAGAAGSTDQAGEQVDSALLTLRATATEARLSGSLPSRPEVPVSAVDAPRRTGGEADSALLVPSGPLDDHSARTTLIEVRAAAQQRSNEITDADETMVLVEKATGALTQAERRLADAERRFEGALAVDREARESVQQETEVWRQAAVRWDQAFGSHVAACDHLATVPSPPPASDADVAIDHERLIGERRSSIDAARAGHAQRVATLQARLDQERRASADARAVVEELAARELPDPPAAAWQTVRPGPSLAEFVDFRAELTDQERAGLEAALEASGLLAAEVRSEGLLSRDGELLVGSGAATHRSLADALSIVLPAGPEESGLDETAAHDVLAAVSVDPDDLERADGPAAVVTSDGRFRVGPLRGWHRKHVAEHIGVTARRAALERQRAAAATAAQDAAAAVATTEAERGAALELAGAADQLLADLPATTELVRALASLDHAERAVATAREELGLAEDARLEAERVHADRLDTSRRRCAELDLPHDRAALRITADACRLVPSHVDNVGTSLDGLARAVLTWLGAADRLVRAEARRSSADLRHQQREQQHTLALAELATLEDQIGLDVKDVLAAIDEADRSLKIAERELTESRDLEGPARERVGITSSEALQASAARDRSELACAATLDGLRAAATVSGLLGAALAGPDHDQGGAVHETGEVDADDATDRDGGGDPVLVHLPAVPSSSGGLRTYAKALLDLVPDAPPTPADNVRNALRARRPDLGAGWDAQDHQPDPLLPLSVEVVGPLGTMPLARAASTATGELRTAQGLLSAQQDEALRNLLQGLIADEVAEKMHAASELVDRMNGRLVSVRTSHGVGVSLRWKRRDDLTEETGDLVDLLAKRSDLRPDPDADARLVAALSRRIDEARRNEPEAPYAALIARIFDYRDWHRMSVMVHRPGRDPERLKRGTALSEGEKKMVSYQPLFAAVAASCDALAESAPDAPRFVLLDDAFAKVSEDNHPKLFGLLVDLDLDFIATSERLWGTHATVPELAITEVLRDADAGVIVLEHSYWDGHVRTEPA